MPPPSIWLLLRAGRRSARHPLRANPSVACRHSCRQDLFRQFLLVIEAHCQILSPLGPTFRIYPPPLTNLRWTIYSANLPEMSWRGALNPSCLRSVLHRYCRAPS